MLDVRRFCSVKQGVKVTPDAIVGIARRPTGQIVWLETGTAQSGLTHILREHESHFADVGIAADRIPSAVVRAASEGKLVGFTGRDMKVYELEFDNVLQRIGVLVGSNGYIVTATPVH